MMKNLVYLGICVLLLNCGTKKEEKKVTTTPEKAPTEVKAKTSSGADKDLLDPKQDVIVVFKNPNITETEDLISEKGLKLEKILFDQTSLKVGLIKVPADKKDFWLDQLIQSGNFKDVKLYSEKALKELIKKEKK